SFFFFFFFSSRRRHTSFSREWSSDVCSSDLPRAFVHLAAPFGYVDPGRRREVYEGARLLVQPSFEEGFGMTALEAMTLGVPVVEIGRASCREGACARGGAGGGWWR